MSTATPATTSLELLLADFDHRPALQTGLPENAAGNAPKPQKAPRGVDSMSLEAPDADPNDLSLQRWGVIIANSEAGNRALEAIRPLFALRQSEQDAKEYDEPLENVRRSLPAEGEKPFLAALPKAALANENGPLGIIAFVRGEVQRRNGGRLPRDVEHGATGTTIHIHRRARAAIWSSSSERHRRRKSNTILLMT